MGIIIKILIGYVVLSLLIGLVDLISLYTQDRYFDDIPQGDIGYYQDRKDILGIHNWIFFPSWIIIWPFTR